MENRTGRAWASLSLIALLAISACSPELDYGKMSVPELLQRSESGVPDESNAAREELFRRPRPAAATQLLELVRDETFAHRHLAAQTLGAFFLTIFSRDALDEVQLEQIRTTLRTLVKDPDERVQLAALTGLVIDWWPRRVTREELPAGTAAILRRAL